MNKQQSEERRRLSGFIGTVFEFLNAQASMAGAGLSQFDQIRWNDAPTRGLRLAAGDMVEWCHDLTGDRLAVFDAALVSKQLPTLISSSPVLL